MPAVAAKRRRRARSSARPTRRSAASTNGAGSRCRCRRRAFTTGRLAVRLVRRDARGATPRRARLGGEPRRRTATRSGVGSRSHASVLRRRPRAAARRCGGCRCKSTAPYADLGGEQLIEWGGALRWLVGGERADPATRARLGPRRTAAMRRCFARADKSVGVFASAGRAAARDLHKRLKAVFDPHGHPEPRPPVRLRALMQTNLAPDFIRDTPRGPRGRRDPAHVRALRLLHGDVPDVPAARRRARRPARAHLPHQGGARGRAGHREDAAAPRPLPHLPQLRDDVPVGRAVRPAASTSAARSSTRRSPRSAAGARARATRCRKALLREAAVRRRAGARAA